MNTMHFGSCRVVFQGGGCRAAALAGAYREAWKHGAVPTAVAGTSAGSIMAALVGAGAPPEKILELLHGLDFRSLLPTSALSSLGGKWINLLTRSGFYSSERLESWIEKNLAELLPEVKGYVRFKDLVLPTSIVATDLAALTTKVWSSDGTPDESVAFAVRASCSIPFFFQPVSQGRSRFVDGGLLSNLPVFVFQPGIKRLGAPQPEPVLGFRLMEKNCPPERWSITNVASKTISAVVDGATDLQLSMQGNVSAISIDTRDIKATDFLKMNNEKVNSLISWGEEAARTFFNSEQLHFSHSGDQPIECRDRYETYSAIAGESDVALKRVMISERNTVWFWKLFPSVLQWLSRGAEVFVLVPELRQGDDPREAYRRKVMMDLGVHVVEEDQVPEIIYHFIRSEESQSSMIVGSGSDKEFLPDAVRYAGLTHGLVLRGVFHTLSEKFRRATRVEAKLDLRPMRFEDLAARLKNVAQYAPEKVEIRMEQVDLAKVDLVVEQLRAYKYKQVGRFIGLIAEKKLSLFEPMQLINGLGRESIVVPPVLERIGDRYLAVEGNTRSYYCWRNGMTTMNCVVVSNVASPLPGKPIRMERVRIVPHYVPAEGRMKNFQYQNFRGIEGAAR